MPYSLFCAYSIAAIRLLSVLSASSRKQEHCWEPLQASNALIRNYQDLLLKCQLLNNLNLKAQSASCPLQNKASADQQFIIDDYFQNHSDEEAAGFSKKGNAPFILTVKMYVEIEYQDAYPGHQADCRYQERYPQRSFLSAWMLRFVGDHKAGHILLWSGLSRHMLNLLTSSQAPNVWFQYWQAVLLTLSTSGHPARCPIQGLAYCELSSIAKLLRLYPFIFRIGLHMGNGASQWCSPCLCHIVDRHGKCRWLHDLWGFERWTCGISIVFNKDIIELLVKQFKSTWQETA